MAAYDGHGTTITFGTTGYSAGIISVDGPGIERESIDATLMSTTTAKAYIVASLYDGGNLELTVEHDPAIDAPIANATETITINWGGTGTGNWSFSGFCTGYKPGASIGERMTASMTVKVTGAVTMA